MNYEKVSVNVNDKKLSQIDLLIENNFYSNRSEFINAAIEALLEKEDKNIQKILDQNFTDSYILNNNIWFIGVSEFDKDFLSRVKYLNKKIKIKGFGVLTFSKDCDDELIFETVESISHKIKVVASDKVKKFYKRED